MPLDFTIAAAHRRTLTVGSGEITYPEILAHMARRHEAGVMEWPELVDGTTGTPSFTPAEVRRIVEQMREFGREHRLAPIAVVVADDVSFGMVRMLGTLAEELCEVRPFRRRADAEAWLDSLAGPQPPAPPG